MKLLSNNVDSFMRKLAALHYIDILAIEDLNTRVPPGALINICRLTTLGWLSLQGTHDEASLAPIPPDISKLTDLQVPALLAVAHSHQDWSWQALIYAKLV